MYQSQTMVALQVGFALLFLLSTYNYFGVEAEFMVCDSTAFQQMKIEMGSLRFCDKNLPYEVRAKDLIDRMTLEEKVAQLGDKAMGVQRLNLPGYEWWSEALHGVSDVGPGTRFNQTVPAATSFPTVILTTSSFNETLWKTIGEVVSDEARAMYNLGLAGLTFWSPTINVARDPRWGRITETPGEDPFVVGSYAVNYVRGLQDVKGFEISRTPNSRPLKVGACCKHFAAYDVDNWKGTDRYHFDAQVTARDMIETFIEPFRMCVKDGDVASVMCSYNRVNGIPVCADPELLNGTIRQHWNLNGYIVADCDSVEVMVNGHKFLNDTPVEAVGQALNAGMDLDCGKYYPNYATSAVKQGKVKESEIDESLKNLFIVLMRLGWFDGSPGGYSGLGKNDVCSPAHLELSAEAARQGIVLLKNDKNTLPLIIGTGKPKFAVVGPHANASVAMIGNYALKSGVACHYSIPIDEIAENGDVVYAAGCQNVKCPNSDGIGQAVQVSKQADATFIFVGLDLSIEAESLDRNDLNFPGFQKSLITQISEAATKPVIVVIFSAGGIDISFLQQDPKVQAIVWAGYPGAEGGRAIADVIFGKYNPAGRLPITWYPASYVNQLPMTSMPLRPIPESNYPGRTYKFYNGSTIYPFGYGLSYTTFKYAIRSTTNPVMLNLGQFQQCKPLQFLDGRKTDCPAILVDETHCTQLVMVKAMVTNTGKSDGPLVVFVYSVPPSGIVGTPIKRLVGFKRVFVAAGTSQVVLFKLNACRDFNIVTDDAYELLPSGQHTIIVGNGDDAVSTQITIGFNHN
ncbi:beta-xylosidase/alpha-L-arabinofuranosidase 1-like [Telopea speciosissima]|uniref:beta-xylosidase/alpha-L-arabinofuranosidase 1-like n=1 Tax=Telopea speciosissima TaxID=54955 RepID=UPI001CC5DFBD|nr:beta-xylosidase/alpha-L-arabinofuranosidase 1-like [Telopea speciosissima]